MIVEEIDFEETHIDGFFDILTDAFTLVRDFVGRPENLNEKGLPKTQKTLSELYEITKKIKNKEQMTQSIFLEINMLLAMISANYKKDIPDDSGYIAENMSFLNRDNPQSNYLNRMGIFIREESGFFKQNHSCCIKVIYGQPLLEKARTVLGYDSFVNEQFEKHRKFLLLFDITSKPTFKNDGDFFIFNSWIVYAYSRNS